MTHPSVSEEACSRMSAEIRAEALAGCSSQADPKAFDRMLRSRIEQLVLTRTAGLGYDIPSKRKIVEGTFNAMRRLDILEPLLQDPTVSEIMVNGPECVFIERSGQVERTRLRFDSAERLVSLIMRIAARVNRSVNESEPIVDARLEDGSRVNAVLKPIALNGPVLTIRKFPEKPMTLAELVRIDALSPEAAQVLNCLVRARCNLFVCGGTGSGKTTLLNALSACIPSDERIITIEDSAELQLGGIENLVRMETRTANTEGRGEIGIRELIRTSLRMRPERIIVGEVRGAEALDMLQAMNTGHDGSMSTGHANSSEDMLSRLETMVLSAAPLPLDAIRKQIASAIEVIIFLSRFRDKSRKIVSIEEVCGVENGAIRLRTLYAWRSSGQGLDGTLCGRLERVSTGLERSVKLDRYGIAWPVAVNPDGKRPETAVSEDARLSEGGNVDEDQAGEEEPNADGTEGGGAG